MDTLGEPLKEASEVPLKDASAVGDGESEGEEEPLDVSLMHQTRDQKSIKNSKFIVSLSLGG